MIRKDSITAHGRTSTGGDAYDDDGNLVPIVESTFTFRGSIESVKSNLQYDIAKRRNTRNYEINVDSRSISNLTIDHYLTINGGTDKYQVVDIFDGDISGIDYDATILCKYIR